MEDEDNKDLRMVRLVWAGAFLSFLVATNLLFSLFCSNWPLIVYLMIGGLGAWLGPKLNQRFSKNTFFSKLVRRSAVMLAGFSLMGLVALFMLPAHWESKCAWRYCGRAMGPSPLTSPFPVGDVSCRAWSMCVNEYPYRSGQMRDVYRRMEEQGCPAP